MRLMATRLASSSKFAQSTNPIAIHAPRVLFKPVEWDICVYPSRTWTETGPTGYPFSYRTVANLVVIAEIGVEPAPGIPIASSYCEKRLVYLTNKSGRVKIPIVSQPIDSGVGQLISIEGNKPSIEFFLAPGFVREYLVVFTKLEKGTSRGAKPHAAFL